MSHDPECTCRCCIEESAREAELEEMPEDWPESVPEYKKEEAA